MAYNLPLNEVSSFCKEYTMLYHKNAGCYTEIKLDSDTINEIGGTRNHVQHMQNTK